MATGCAFVSQAPAQPIFKSIDADGNVTYSSTPPRADDVKRVETVELPPGPSPEAQAEAERRMRSIEAAARQQAAERAGLRQAERTQAAAARDNLEAARRALAEAQKRDSPQDWQTLATGGRVPSANYLQRVAEAKERVRQAEQALSRARQQAR